MGGEVDPDQLQLLAAVTEKVANSAETLAAATTEAMSLPAQTRETTNL